MEDHTVALPEHPRGFMAASADTARSAESKRQKRYRNQIKAAIHRASPRLSCGLLKTNPTVCATFHPFRSWRIEPMCGRFTHRLAWSAAKRKMVTANGRCCAGGSSRHGPKILPLPTRRSMRVLNGRNRGVTPRRVQNSPLPDARERPLRGEARRPSEAALFDLSQGRNAAEPRRLAGALGARPGTYRDVRSRPRQTSCWHRSTIGCRS